MLAGRALFVFAAGFFEQILRPYRKQAAFLVLMLVLGPGLLVNMILKDNMGRARPTDIIGFGGSYQYSEPWQYGVSPKQKSFPSGHASIAFYMMAPWFIYRNRQKKLGLIFLGFGLSFGLLTGLSRMVQGGHYLSDVLWSGGLVYLCGVVLSWVLDPALKPSFQRGNWGQANYTIRLLLPRMFADALIRPDIFQIFVFNSGLPSL